MVTVTEGFVPFRGMRTWYRVAGDLGSAKTPLLLLQLQEFIDAAEATPAS